MHLTSNKIYNRQCTNVIKYSYITHHNLNRRTHNSKESKLVPLDYDHLVRNWFRFLGSQPAGDL